jgi:hypothetical protein
MTCCSDVLYAGICHSDIHIARSDWRPAKYPIMPGHEIIGRVQAVGSASDTETMNRLTSHFDLLISTVAVSYPMQPFMNLLKLDAGQRRRPGRPAGIERHGPGLRAQESGGSMIGGIAETQE